MTDPIHYLDVPVQQAGVPSITGKIYPEAELKKLESYSPRFGELNPGRLRGSSLSLGNIDMANASHEVSNFRMVDGTLVADFKVIPKFPMGKVLDGVFDLCRPALRAFVQMDENKVVTNMQLVTVDMVADTELLNKKEPNEPPRSRL